MFKRTATKLAIYLLRSLPHHTPERDDLFREVVDMFQKKSLSIEERQLLTTLILEKLGTLPLHAKITLDPTGKIVVNGRPLGGELDTILKRDAASMKNNRARNLVRETVLFLAIKDGVHKNITPEMGLFAKAAIWFHHEEDELYNMLAPDNAWDDDE